MTRPLNRPSLEGLRYRELKNLAITHGFDHQAGPKVTREELITWLLAWAEKEGK